MRPLELRLAHFGPYRDQAVLDFESLDRLFLVCGPTGAGKTTLFDALTYALYEKTAGTRGGLTDQLASHHAPEGAVPEVSLRFSLATQQWRVTRQLRHRVPKKKGEGWVVQEPQVLLEKLVEGAWEPQPGKRTEINAKLEDLLGLSADEFGKIVVLPQGDFQRFLEASTGDRERMLQKLFPVEVYERFVESWKQRAKAVEETRQRWEDKWQELTSRLGPGDDRPVLEAAWAEATAAAQVAAAEESKLAAELVRLQGLQTEWETLGKHRSALARLEARRPELERRRTTLEAGRRARPWGADLDRQEAILREGKTLRAEQDAAKDQLARVEAELASLATKAATAAEREARLVAMVKERGVLEHLGEAWKEKVVLEGQEAEARRAEEALQSRANQARDARLLAEQRLVPAPAGPTWDEALPRLEAARNLLRRVELGLARDQAAREAQQATQRADEAERELVLWTQIVDALGAAALADALQEGGPCPVCGSLEHPRPAKRPEASTEAPSRLAAAREAFDALRASASATGGRRDSLQAQLDALGPEPRETREEAARELAAAEAHVAALQAWTKDQESARQQVSQAVEAEAEAERGLQAARQRREQLTAKLLALGDTVPEDPAPRLQALRAEEEKLRTALEQERKLAESMGRDQQGLFTRIEGLETRLSTQREEYRRLQSALETGAEAQGWTLDELKRSRRAEAELATLETEVAAFDLEFQRLVGEMSALEAKFASGPPAPLEPLERECDTTRARRQSLEADAKEKEFALRERDRVEDELREIGRQKQAVEAEFQRLVPLARALDGHNPANLKLTTWVLVQALEQVTHSASHRLASMSGGRYALRVQTQGSDARRAWGLDLAVIDGYTGQERAVGTLSGGEKFMTSISLALGLADVIQERSGGLKLEAIFIDEGFGTLDDQSLERAMAILHDLGQHRSVGIISHVAELRSRIASRVEVIKGRNGSSLRVG